ncbi:hypothetical protein KSP40_PGU002288 [Platanthera guangdongensis]|uniref:Uncharacterized protein n=1 Tax=Platanthera guangdongensis TaxID=2320717 RepID=A0ABR2LYR3_9ASPA
MLDVDEQLLDIIFRRDLVFGRALFFIVNLTNVEMQPMMININLFAESDSNVAAITCKNERWGIIMFPTERSNGFGDIRWDFAGKTRVSAVTGGVSDKEMENKREP